MVNHLTEPCQLFPDVLVDRDPKFECGSTKLQSSLPDVTPGLTATYVTTHSTDHEISADRN